MNGETVLVTGAGGCIGGRIAQRIVMEDRGTVRPLVHHLSKPGAMRLARLPVDVEAGSVTDRARIDDVIDGCDVVVHCAGGTRPGILTGTRTVLEAAIEADVETFVHLSTAAIHGHDVDGRLREESPIRPDTNYTKWKAKVEDEIMARTADVRLSPIIFRPYIVFGPHSKFVRWPIQDVQAGAVLADGGVGPVNHIYVDNLVDAIFQAIATPAADGEVFLICDDQQVSWREYYDAIGDMVGDHPPIRERSRRRIRIARMREYLKNSVVPPVNVLKYVLTSEDVHREAVREFKRMPWLMKVFGLLPEGARAPIRAVADRGSAGSDFRPPEQAHGNGAEYSLPPEHFANLHGSRGRVSNRKAKEVLGWSPRVSYQTGLDRTASWVKYAELAGGPRRTGAAGDGVGGRRPSRIE